MKKFINKFLHGAALFGITYLAVNLFILIFRPTEIQRLMAGLSCVFLGLYFAFNDRITINITQAPKEDKEKKDNEQDPE